MTRIKSPGQLDLFDCEVRADPHELYDDPRFTEVAAAFRAIVDNWDDLFGVEITDSTEQSRAYRVLEICWAHLQPLFPIIPPYENDDSENGAITPASLRLAAMKSQALAKFMIKMATVVPIEEFVEVFHYQTRREKLCKV